MRVLLLDIETSPNLGYFFGLWKQNIGINQIEKAGEVIGFAAKWEGSSKTFWYSVYHNTKTEMVEAAHRLLDEADVVVHYNGTTFDMPWLRTEFVLAGMEPPSPWVDVDLCNVSKRVFRFPSNKLAYVTQALGLETKLETGGFQLWRDCMTGEPEVKKRAWSKMRRYCMKDTQILEPLLHRLRPYMKSYPNPALYSGEPDIDQCRCTSTNLKPRGYTFTNLSKFRRYRCDDCGAWSRGKHSMASVDVRPAR